MTKDDPKVELIEDDVVRAFGAQMLPALDINDLPDITIYPKKYGCNEAIEAATKEFYRTYARVKYDIHV